MNEQAINVVSDPRAATRASGESLTLLDSRDRAVERIVKGGGLAAVGAATFAVGAALPTTPLFYIGFVVGGIALAGCGLLEIGRAASHLRRFGGRGASHGLVASAGLGVSMATFALTHVMLIVSDIETGVRALNDLAALGSVTFAALLALLTLRALIGWMTGSGESEGSESSPEH